MDKNTHIFDQIRDLTTEQRNPRTLTIDMASTAVPLPVGYTAGWEGRPPLEPYACPALMSVQALLTRFMSTVSDTIYSLFKDKSNWSGKFFQFSISTST